MNGFDGIVADTGYLGLRMPSPDQEDNLMMFLKTIADELHKEGKLFILVEPVNFLELAAIYFLIILHVISLIDLKVLLDQMILKNCFLLWTYFR